MNVKEERIEVTFTDLTRTSLLFELKPGGLVVMTEEGCEARAVGSIPKDGEALETDFHEWCAGYVHRTWTGKVLMTQATRDIG